MTFTNKHVLATTTSVLVMAWGAQALAQASSTVGVADAASTGSATPAQRSGPAGSTLEEVVVTARRRQESLQQVPLAVTALGGQELAKHDVHSGGDLQHSVPSLNVNSPFGGETGFVSIRGQGTTYTGTIANPGVTSYFAEVPMPGGLVTSGAYFDLQNIQVLKGPQGTLFGRNSLGGAVLFQPQRPTNKFSGYIQGVAGNYNRNGVEGAINIPLARDTLLLRVSGQYNHRNGYATDYISRRKYNDQNDSAIRLSVLWKPNDSIDNYLIASHANSHDHGTAFVLNYVDPNNAIIQGYNAILGLEGLPTLTQYLAQQQARGPFSIATNANPSGKTNVDSVQDTLTLRLNDDFTVKNIASFAHLEQIYAREDWDGTPYPFFDTVPLSGSFRVPLAGGGTAPLPHSLDSGGDYINQNTYTEELQLQGVLLNKALQFSTGFYFQRDEPKTFGANLLEEFLVPGSGAKASSLMETATTSETKSLYGQGTLDFRVFSDALANLKLTLGYRHTWDDTTGISDSFVLGYPNVFNLFGLPLASPGTCVYPPNPGDPPQSAYHCDSSVTKHFQADTWNVSLDYQLSPTKMIYVASRHGYKAGGVNNTSPPALSAYTPETLTDEEIGFKADWKLGDNINLRTDLAAYHGRQIGIQQVEQIAYTPPGASAPVEIAPVISSSSGDSYGVEFEATLIAFDRLELSGYYDYNQFSYDKFVNSTYAFGDAAQTTLVNCAPGDPGYKSFSVGSGICNSTIHPRAPYLPHNKFSITGRYHVFEKAAPAGDLSLSATYTYQSSAADGQVDLAHSDFIPGYGLLSLSLDWDRIMGGHVSASLFADNVTNKVYETGDFGVTTSLGISTLVYGPPRMYGAKLRYDW